MATAPPAGQNTTAIRRREGRGSVGGAGPPEAPPCWNTRSCGDSAWGSVWGNGFRFPTRRCPQAGQDDRSRAPPSDRLDLQLAALRATSCLPSAFVNKVLSAHGHTHSLTHGRFLLNSRVESLQHRPQGWKHLLAGPLRKSLLNPGLEADVLSGAEVARTEPLSYTV